MCLIDDDLISRRYDYRNVKLTQMRWRTRDLRTSATVLPVVELSSSPVLIAVVSGSGGGGGGGSVVVDPEEALIGGEAFACTNTRIWGVTSAELLRSTYGRSGCVCLVDDDQISRRYDYRNIKSTQMNLSIRSYHSISFYEILCFLIYF